GMERNSDLIIMASYAPLLINVNPGAGQWYTNMIGFDANTSFASPSYYAQSLFAGHLGNGTAKTSLTGANPRFFQSSTVSSADKVLHLKLVNASSVAQPLAISLDGVSGNHTANITSLHAETFEATNTITDPNVIHPIPSTAKVSGATWQ
ncbi:alpha-L-arabinofuranosidase C-terminal domain-containing protein, partial [Xanthomonas citri pv. citri]